MIKQTQSEFVRELDLVPLAEREVYRHLDLFFQTNPSQVEDRSRHLHIIFGDLYRNTEGIHTPDLDAAREIARGIVNNPDTSDSAVQKASVDYRTFKEVYE